MKELLCLVLILHINLVFPQNFDLSDQIHRQVQESLRGTQHLGDMIAQNIRRQLLPLNDLPNSISDNIRKEMLPIRNLGNEIRQNVRRKLIPVYAMRLREDMKNGIGGTTVVTYASGRTFIIQEGERFTCDGIIERSICNGVIKPFEPSSNEDYCYSLSYATFDDNVCLSNSALNVEVYNHQFSCRSSDDSPTVILSKKEYQDLCRQSTRANYKYYANLSDPSAVAIPNPNPQITCLNNERGVCEFQDTIVRGRSVVSNHHDSFYSSFNG